MNGLENAKIKAGPDILSGWDWYQEKYDILKSAQTGTLILDIGCKEGSWINDATPFIPPGVIRIGIDPSDTGPHCHRNMEHYYCCAIDDIDYPTSTLFHTFDEPGCNSLLPKSSHLNRNMIRTIMVPVTSLEAVLLGCVGRGTIIHYLKCDCQGKDIDVVKSLRSFIPYTNYVQIEVSFSRDQPFYQGQTYYQDDIATMANMGFEPLCYIVYPASPLPEGEILFGRKQG